MLKKIIYSFALQNMIAKLLNFFPAVVDHNLGKYLALKKAFFLTNLDGVEGDYLEFGVFTGSSMSAAVESSRRPLVARSKPVRFIGFDSFRGFGELKKGDLDHPFYKDINFKTDFKSVEARLRKLVKDPGQVVLVDGFFEDTLKGKSPSDYGIEKASVVLIDCDLYSAATLAFDFIASVLQEGSILVIDDFFSYKGSPTAGTAGAFAEFQAKNDKWCFRQVTTYGCGGAVFVAGRPS